MPRLRGIGAGEGDREVGVEMVASKGKGDANGVKRG